MNEAAETPIEAAWERIENWLMDNAPFTLVSLNDGATERDIWACEAAVGFRLPAEVAESWRIHNGQPEGMLIVEAQLLPLDQMAAARQRRDEQVRLYGAEGSEWNPHWLPLTSNEAGDHVCLDTQSGQIVSFLHDEGNAGIVAANYTNWLHAFADDLEAEKYVWSSDMDGLARRDLDLEK